MKCTQMTSRHWWNPYLTELALLLSREERQPSIREEMRLWFVRRAYYTHSVPCEKAYSSFITRLISIKNVFKVVWYLDTISLQHFCVTPKEIFPLNFELDVVTGQILRMQCPYVLLIIWHHCSSNYWPSMLLQVRELAERVLAVGTVVRFDP